MVCGGEFYPHNGLTQPVLSWNGKVSIKLFSCLLHPLYEFFTALHLGVYCLRVPLLGIRYLYDFPSSVRDTLNCSIIFRKAMMSYFLRLCPIYRHVLYIFFFRSMVSPTLWMSAVILTNRTTWTTITFWGVLWMMDTSINYNLSLLKLTSLSVKLIYKTLKKCEDIYLCRLIFGVDLNQGATAACYSLI